MPGHLIERSPCPVHAHKYTGSWKTTRARILDRDHHRCVMCGAPCPHPKHHHVDHISHTIPNRDHPSNLRTTCATFNLGGQQRCR